MDSFDFANQATFPLTLFDRLFERTTFLTGWLVEGTIDTDALSRALANVTQKWRMLSGRLESMPNEDDVTEWRIRIPLGDIPADYKTFALTTSTSEHPLSHYLSLPLPTVSRSLPHALFIHPSTPRQYTVWESKKHPLTCWHITSLPPDPSSPDGKSYTCIGFARSHGIFDGVGAGAIMRALVSEMKGEEWEAPPLPPSGFNINPVQRALDARIQAHADDAQGAGAAAASSATEGYCGFVDLGVAGAVKEVAWHLRERLWYEADRRIVLMPKDVLSFLVDGVRTELRGPHEDGLSTEVTTGDVLVAWLLKTVYSTGTSPKSIIQCSNLASFRSLLSEDDPSILQYAHNAFIPLPYPSMTVSQLTQHTLPSLAHLLAVSRTSLSTPHILSSYNALSSPTAFPANPNAHETLVISNVSASRILEADWSLVGAEAGAGRTVCGYRYQLTPTELLMTNGVYIAGRLPEDGSVVLDVSLNKRRVEVLERALGELVSKVREG